MPDKRPRDADLAMDIYRRQEAMVANATRRRESRPEVPSRASFKVLVLRQSSPAVFNRDNCRLTPQLKMPLKVLSSPRLQAGSQTGPPRSKLQQERDSHEIVWRHSCCRK